MGNSVQFKVLWLNSWLKNSDSRGWILQNNMQKVIKNIRHILYSLQVLATTDLLCSKSQTFSNFLYTGYLLPTEIAGQHQLQHVWVLLHCSAHNMHVISHATLVDKFSFYLAVYNYTCP